MPLEFPCPHCQHLLRTADDKAGLSATCPACGESIWVPYPHQIGTPEDQPPPPPDPGEDSEPDQYEFANEDPFDGESAPKSAPEKDPFAGETPPPAEQPDADRHQPESGVSGAVARHSDARAVLTCSHCGTENEPDARNCRACAADLSPTPPDQGTQPDGWQPRVPDLGEIIQSSWKIYSDELGLLIGGWLLYVVMIITGALCSAIPFGLVMAILAAANADLIWVGIIGGILLGFPFFLLVLAILNIGYIQFCFNVARGTSAGVGDLLYGFGDGRSLIPGAFVVALVSFFANLPTCGLAAILIWPLWYAQVYRRANAGEALGAGFGMVQQEFLTVFVVGLIVFACSFVVNAIPYIGIIILIFVMPLLEILHAVAYLRMERERIVVDRD